MSIKKGSLSINSENIFPIIKKWLYSDHDIFVRELVSNATDAITKLRKLALIGEYNENKDEKYRVDISISPKEKSITFTDNGLGMTMEEVDEYINQIAFSGAKDFMEKYKDKANDDQIIGHFGLGFYSSFMVADKVELSTLSYKDGAKAVKWISQNGTEFEMDFADKSERGTTIKLYLNDESFEFSNEYRIREILDKYCSFMPVEIFLKDVDAEERTQEIPKDELKDNDVIIEEIIEPAKTEEKTLEDGTKQVVELEPAKEKYKIKEREKAINNTKPLWNKHPNECSEDDYKSFYRELFKDYKEPLFWIHLNMDYPFNLKGILYFPKINTEYESIEGVIKLYNNQVFIADNIKEVIPEFLMLLKGVIDCPDLPLNVSRSALQNDGFVKKISDYISKKVADKLNGMCKTDRENYEKYWDDISPFIKFGCLKDEKFAEKINDSILFKDIDNKYSVLKDIKPEEAKETKVYYVTDLNAQSQYISHFRELGKNAFILSHNIDAPFISLLEAKNEGLKFLRIDSDILDEMKDTAGSDNENEQKLDSLKEEIKKSVGNPSLDIQIEYLKNSNIASMITLSEESRRMQDMMKQYGMAGLDPSMFGAGGQRLVLNANHDLVKKLMGEISGENITLISEQLYDLASLGHGSLTPERMAEFIKRSNEIMLKL